MTMRGLATGTLLLTLLLTACGEDGETGDEAADPTPTGSPSASPSESPTSTPTESGEPAEPVLATTPGLLQCLVQDGLLAGGPTATELDGGTTSERIWVTLSDGSEFDPVTGALHVLADEAQAVASADALLAEEIAAEEVPQESASATVHGNVVAVLESDAGDTDFAAVFEGCLPGADPATAVEPPADGTVTLASLMECAASLGMTGFGEHSFFDVEEQRVGSVVFGTPNDYGSSDEQATVYVFPDAATAEAREAATIGDQEARLFERRGNAIVRFIDSLDASNPVPDQVRGCLP